MKPFPSRRAAWPLAALAVLLIACAGIDPPPVQAANTPAWPPLWQDTPIADGDSGPPAFQAPSATHCRREPGTRELPGASAQSTRAASAEYSKRTEREHHPATEARRMKSAAPAGVAAAELAADAVASFAAPPGPSAQPAPMPSVVPGRAPPRQRPPHEPVTAAVVDDNADFGEYLAYRQRKAGLPVRERDVSERYLLEVTDAKGRPVHDAEVAVQRPGVAEPVMWARTDTAGRVWLQPRVFLSPQGLGGLGERALGVWVRKAGHAGRATLVRGQTNAVQVRLGGQPVAAVPRLDLVFLVDATGSMGDEIAKLKHSMQAMARQIAQLPAQPDICWGLVAYRDRGDAFITRSHDFTHNLAAFQDVLAKVQASGGGDTPEALNEALHEVVHGLSWRADATRLVVLVADAPPHLDYDGCTSTPALAWEQQVDGVKPSGACPQYDRDMQAALAKGIKVFAVGASGLDPVGEYIFRQIAQYTAGRFVFLTYRDADNPGGGPGTKTVHDVKQYSVQTLDQLVLRLVGEELARLPRG